MKTSTISIVDLILTISNLANNSETCQFLDTSEGSMLGASIVFFEGDSQAAVGIVFTDDGGSGRIFNKDLDTVAQTVGPMSLEDFTGIYNLMLTIYNMMPYEEIGGEEV